MVFAPLMVFYRDTGGFLPYSTRLWLYMTPALYSIREIPPGLKTYLRFNPLYPLFGALEQVFGGRFPSSGYVLGRERVGGRALLGRRRGVPRSGA